MATKVLTNFEGSSSLPATFNWETGFAVATNGIFGAGFGSNYVNLAGTNTRVFTSASTDGLSGNCRVSMVVRGDNFAAGQSASSQIFFRASVNTAVSSSFLAGDSYRVTFSVGPAATNFSLIRRTTADAGGIQDRTLATTANSGVTFDEDVNYEIHLSGNGAALKFEIQNLATGLWLNAANNGWQSSRVACISVTDTSGLGGGGAPILVAGYYGARQQVLTAGTNIYTDNIRLSDLTTPATSSATITGAPGLTGTLTASNFATGGVTWSSSNTGVATINSTTGAWTLVAAGTCTFTATGVTDPGETATSAVTVSTAATLTPSTATINQGAIQALTPANFSGAVTYSSSNISVATVNASTGVVTGQAHGQATGQSATITGTDGTNTATASITVRAVSVTPVPSSQTLNAGDVLNIIAGVAGSTNTGATYSSSNTGIATVNSSGKVTSVSAGSATITVTSAADTARTGTVALTVAAVPAVTYPSNWRVPGTKLYGVNVISGTINIPIQDLIDLGKTSEISYAKSFSPTYWPTTLAMFDQACQRAAAMGANAVRNWSMWPEGASDYGQSVTYFTAAQHVQHAIAFARVCAKYGLYYYPCGSVGYVYNSPPLLTFTQYASWSALLAAGLEPEPNVIGIDLMNEAFPGHISDANATLMVSAAKAAAPTLPVTMSCNNLSSAAAWNSFPLSTATAAGFDFLDGHGYYDNLPSDYVGLESASPKPFIVGEGGSVNPNSENVQGRWLALSETPLVRTHCAGVFAWAVNHAVIPAGGQGLYSPTGLEYVGTSGQRLVGYCPKPPLKTNIYHRFTTQDNTDVRYRLYTGPASSGGFTQAGYSNSNYLVTGAGGYSAFSTASAAKNYLSHAIAYPDFTLTSTFLALVDDSTQPHNGGILFGADVFASSTSEYFAGYDNTTGKYIISWTANGSTTILGSGGSALTASRPVLSLVVSGTGNTATLSVNGGTTVGPITLPRPIKAGSRVGFSLYGTGTDPFCAKDISLTVNYPVTPEVLTLASVGSGTVGLTVSGGTGVATRQLYRSTVSGTPHSTKNAVSGATGTTLSDTGLTNGTTYYYKLISSDANGNVRVSNEVAATPASGTINATTYAVDLGTDAPVAGERYKGTVRIPVGTVIGSNVSVTLAGTNITYSATQNGSLSGTGGATLSSTTGTGVFYWSPTAAGSVAPSATNSSTLTNPTIAAVTATAAAAVASSYAIAGIPSAPVVGQSYAVTAVLNAPASASGTITPTPATGITWGSPIGVTQGATSGATTVTFSAAGSYTPAFTHTGLGITGDPTLAQVTAVAASSGGTAGPTVDDILAKFMANTNGIPVNVVALVSDTTAAANLKADSLADPATQTAAVVAGVSAGVVAAVGTLQLSDGAVADTPAPTTTTFSANGSNLTAGSGGYRGVNVLFQSGANKGAKRTVTSHTVVGSRHDFVIDSANPLPVAPGVADTFKLG